MSPAASRRGACNPTCSWALSLQTVVRWLRYHGLTCPTCLICQYIDSKNDLDEVASPVLKKNQTAERDIGSSPLLGNITANHRCS